MPNFTSFFRIKIGRYDESKINRRFSCNEIDLNEIKTLRESIR